MSQLFRSLHHVCIVVRDLDKTVAYYESIGIGPWFDYPKSSPYLEFEVPSPAASARLRYRCVDLGNVQLQLCEPPQDDFPRTDGEQAVSPQRRFLDEHGEGVYHLGFEVTDQASAEADAQAFGLRILARGRRADGTGFCYFDTRDGAGTVLEIRHSLPNALMG